MREYAAYVFDFDYTLADATTGIVESFNTSLRDCGQPEATVDAIRRTVGMMVPEAFAELTGTRDPALTERLIARFRERADEVMTPGTVLLPGAGALLEGLRRAGKASAVVSNKYRYRILEMLALNQAAHLIDLVVGYEDVAVGKPDPEGLHAALAALHCAPADCLYVGDSLIDAQTAQAAGVDFAAVTTGTTSAADFADIPHVAVAPSLPELLPAFFG